MKKEKSCGSIIIKNEKIVLVRHNIGHWGLPKGHVEENETEIETAIRETKEETNLDVELDPSKRYVANYIIDDSIDKTVVYFVATKVKGKLKRQESEISKAEWIPLNEALEKISYDNVKTMLKQVLKDLE